MFKIFFQTYVVVNQVLALCWMDTASQIMSGCQEVFSPSASPEPIVYNPKKPIHPKKTILSHLRTLKANKYTAITLTTDNVQIGPWPS